jgi:predicted outer membrane repeat protein
MSRALILFVAASLSLPVAADQIIVDANGFGDYTNIQDAVDVAEDGDVILVFPGVYNARDVGDPQVVDCLGKAISLVSLAGAATCIIDAELSRRGIVCTSNETNATLIDGFTIRNGAALLGGGAGIRISAASPTIEDCVFENNVTFGNGGGMHVDEGRPLINRCSFDNNAAVDGGGLAVSWASKESGRDLVLSECAFTSNTATQSGGGVHASGMESLNLSDCTIDGGSAVHGGGIAVAFTDQLTIFGSTFTDLDATDAGGGLHMQGGSLDCSECFFRSFGSEADVIGKVMRLESVSASLEYCTFEEMPYSAVALISASDCTLSLAIALWLDCYNINLDATGTGTLEVDSTIFTTSLLDPWSFYASAIRTGPNVDLSVTGSLVSGYTADSYAKAAGIDCHNRATIDNCTFRDNFVECELSSCGWTAAHVSIQGVGTGSTVTNCTFERGYSYNAASGLCAEDIGTLTIAGCSFLDGDDLNQGGSAVVVVGDMDPATTVLIDECPFIDNGGTNTKWGGGYGGLGGGVYSINEVITIRECWFEDNHATNGGSLYGYFDVTNCYIHGNSGEGGGAIYMEGGSITNSKLFGMAECSGGSALVNNARSAARFDRVTAHGGVYPNCDWELGATVEIFGDTFAMQDSYICGGGKIQGQLYLPLCCDYVDLGGNYVNEACCFSDLDHDGSVGGGDLTILLGAWGTSCLGCQADLDDNGVIDGADLTLLLGDWGGCG